MNEMKEMPMHHEESESGVLEAPDLAIAGMQKKPYHRKRWDSVQRDGANLVINRKSLNVESKRKQDGKIRYENERFLEKL